ncbi:MAG: hypothetical protein SPL12_01990 [Bacteroidales bacterium]|nr:hypothetical protein [Bacteroidales bacterium]
MAIFEKNKEKRGIKQFGVAASDERGVVVYIADIQIIVSLQTMQERFFFVGWEKSCTFANSICAKKRSKN